MSEKTKNVRYALVAMLLLFCSAIQAQTVSGNVKDPTGEPIIGATVMEQGTQNGTVTDFDGNFTITLKGKSHKLVFSYVGMQNQTVDVAGKSSVNVAMKDDAQMLDEVVAIGYTTVRKRDLTGAVSQVSAKQIEDIPVSNVTEALTGKMAGVNVTTTEGSPDADITIRVRGGGSLSQDNSPLYIVDGFEVSSINDIASSDIETIDVLKDAASTAIYGARGANGVVIVTTKSGKEGKVNINFNASLGWRKVVKEIGVMDPYNFGMYQYEIASSSQFSTEKGNYGPYAELDQLKSMAGHNWQDEIFGRTGTQRNYDVSVNGGTKKLNFNVSFAHTDQDAIMRGSSYSRNNVTAKLGATFNKWLSADFKFALSRQRVDGLGSGTDSNESNATNSWSNQAIRYAPINAISDDGEEDEENSTSTRVDPLTRVVNTYKKVTTLKHNYNFGLTWKPWKSWRFKTAFSFGFQDKDTDQAWLAIANRNSKYPDSGMPAVVFAVDNKKTITNTNTAQYSKKKILSNADDLKVILGQEWKQTKEDQNGNVYTGFAETFDTFDKILDNPSAGKPMVPTYYKYPDDRITSFFGQVLYTFNDKYYLNATLRADGSSKFGDGNRWGWFPAVQLAWRLTEEEFMKKAEWLSNLKLRLSIGTAGNNRIDAGLIKTQYKASGSTGVAPYFDEQRQYFIETNGYLYNPNLKWETTITRNIGIDFGMFRGKLSGSFDVYWNTTNDLLMKARVQSSSGYLYQYQNFGSTENKGFELSLNYAAISNKNLSLNFNANIAYNKNKIKELTTDDPFQSSSFAGSTISEYNDFYVTEGGRLGEVWGYKYDGFYTTDDLTLEGTTWKTIDGKNQTAGGTIYPGAPKYVDQNGDGKIDTNDKIRLGNTVPTWTGGFGFDVTWKNTWGTIDLTAFFNYSLGNEILNGTRLCNSFYAGSSAGYNLISDFNVDKRYTWVDPATGLNLGRPSANTIAAYGGADNVVARLSEINAGKGNWNPAATSAMLISDWALEKADFLRFQNLTVGYTFPKALVKKLYLQKARIYFTAYNIACWTGYSGYDPEVSTNKNAMCPGIDFATYPKARSYTMGINLQF